MTNLNGKDAGRFLLSRREALRGGSAAVCFGALGAGGAQAATPQKGGTFRVGLRGGASGDSLDPSTYASAQVIFLGYSIRNNLTEIASDGSLKPELAESWESSDAQTWSLKLRSGAEFHSGKSVTPEDVIASLNLHRGEDTKSGAASLLAGVESIEADGKSHVSIKLTAPNADFPFILSDYHFNIVPSNADGSADVGGDGTGGYVLDSFEPGVRTVLKRNPNYWKDGAAHFDSGEVLLINDSTAQTNALITGEIDAINDAEYKTLALLKRDTNVAVESVPGGYHPTFAMQAGTAPFDNNDVRLALKYAVDRQELVDKILKGYGIVANDHPVAPSMRYHDSSIEQRAYDPEKAKFHVKKSGISDLKVKLSVSDSVFPGAVDAATLYREQALKAGIDVEVVREPGDGYWSNVWLQKSFVTSAWGPRPTADMIFTQAYAQEAKWNESMFDNKRFNELLVAARAELDEAKRSAMYGEMQRLVRDNSGAIIPFFRNYVYARRASIGHSGQLGGNWPLDGYKAMERWWKA